MFSTSRLLLILALLGFSLPARAGEWIVPPANYAFKSSVPCELDPAKAARPARPNQAMYRVCDDQMALFRRGLDEAKGSGKLLLVTFGATWCPWCASLQRYLPGPELLGRKGAGLDLARAFHHVEIGLSYIYEGQKEPIPSGDDVLALVLARAPGVKLQMIPFMAVIDPADADRVVARDLGNVAKAGGEFDVARVRAVFVEAYDVMRRKAP
jgi:thiol-disulfide isomerase/thioredoxin